MSTRVPILLYHSISEVASATFRKWTVPPERFADQMRHLSEAGYTSLTAAEFAACIHGATQVPDGAVVVTFDDGYADFAAAAHPVMQRYRISSTLFVTAGYIGGTSAWLMRERETERQMLSWDELQELTIHGVELGGHGYSHRQMDALPLDEALADIALGKDMIERNTGAPVATFAYPHGYSTAALRRGLAHLGFTSAHAVVDAMSSLDDRPFALSRLIVDADMTIGRFRDLVAGIGVPSHPDRDTWRQTAWRSWRKGRIAMGLDRPHVPA